MKTTLLPAIMLLTLLLMLTCENSNTIIDYENVQNEIRTIMDRQQRLWNDGDIEGFMEYYWKSPDFIFQGGNKRLKGWDQLLAMYEKSYGGENRGILDFTDIEIKVMSKDLACVFGKWKVTTEESCKEGLFTLIFKRFDEGWRIIGDHSS